jgi:GNAT superfamily N-acetyltransferase
VGGRRTTWSRAGEVLRKDGLRQLWFRTLGELGYRRQLVTELLLPAEAVDTPRPPDVEARFLGDADPDAYATLHGASREARERFARGERCFGIWLDGRLISSRWLATGTARLGYLGRDVALAPGDVYIYETYTEPGYRGRGISGIAGAVVPAALAAEGERRMVGVLEPENTLGIRANEKAGYRIVGRIGYVKLGPWRRDFGNLA